MTKAEKVKFFHLVRINKQYLDLLVSRIKATPENEDIDPELRANYDKAVQKRENLIEVMRALGLVLDYNVWLREESEVGDGE